MRPVSALRRLSIIFVLMSVLLMSGGIVFALGNNTILAFMLMGSFLVHMGARPERAEWIAVVGMAVLLRMGYTLIGDFHPYFGDIVIRWGSFLGLGSML